MRYKSLQFGKVRYWALILSVAAHSATLAVFTGVKLSGRVSQDPVERSVMNLQTIEQIIAEPAAKPKPRIEPISTPPPQTEQQPLVADPEPPKPETEDSVPETDQPVTPEPTMEPPAVNEVEFFGQKSIVQRICYVVDCSGSMYGRMYQVRQQLKQSILNLNSQQSFAIVFFMEGQKVRTTGARKLEPATAQVKSRAMKLIESIRPSGSTDALHAIQWAMQQRDDSGKSAEVVYFLTDGFDLDSDSSAQFVSRVNRLQQSLVPGTVLHTIGFGPQPQDRQMLRSMSQNSGGQFIEVD